MPTLNAVRRRLEQTYPFLQVLPEWLEPCYDYLTQMNAYTTDDAVFSDVKEQLMLSDLTTSCAPSLPVPLPDTSRLANKSTVLKGSFLLQAVQLDDVSKPALELLNTLEEQRQAEREAAGTKREKTYNMDDVQAGEEPQQQQHEDEMDAPREFARGTTTVALSDGQTILKAFEIKPVNGLGIRDCRLGAKIIVRDAPYVNGLLMLTPENMTVLGHQVEEMEHDRYESLKTGWQQRLQTNKV